MLSIEVLGTIRASRGGEPIELGGPTQRKLLAVLTARRGAPVSTTELMTALWGEEPPPSAQQSLQSYVSRLRRALGADAIGTVAPGYRLDVPAESVDAERFVRISSSLPDDPRKRLDEIREALSLWAGQPFEDIPELDFAARPLIETRLDLEEERARLLALSGSTAEALGVLERVLADEPLRESAWVSLARIQLQAGRQADAIRTLDRYRSLLADIGLEPSRLFKEFEPEVFTADVPAPTGRGIRPPPTSFVGREEEMAHLSGLLRPGRHVTVVGPGGMGKTRLAVETVSTDGESGPSWLVRLGEVATGSGVAPAVINALEVESRGEPEATIVETLRARPGTVVLDSCEHVIDEAAALAHAIIETTDARVLATSREPLNIPGEQVFTLGPLSPERAVLLYRDRALSVNEDFRAADDEIDAVCRLIDYMPLAIEIAASRSLAMSPDEIGERLSRRYGLLGKPRRGEEPRHRTLDDMVAWSYDLLSPESQRVFRRLSVFIGPFDLEGAARVAAFDDVEPDSIAGAIADLVEKSMLAKGEDRGEFHMLRILRSFARVELEGTSNDVEARDRHARHFATVALDIGAGIASQDESKWIERANRCREDLDAALVWAMQRHDYDTVASILEGLFDWFYHRQPPGIARWGEIASRADPTHPVWPLACAWAALAAVLEGDLEGADRIAMSGTTTPEHETTRFAWFMVGDVACYTSDLDRALDAFDRQLVRASATGDPVGVVDALGGQALALAYRGKIQQARDLAEAMQRPARTINAPSYIAYAEYALGEALLDVDAAEASRHLDDAISRARSVGNQFIEGMALDALAAGQIAGGDLTSAWETLIEALATQQQLGSKTMIWATLRYMAIALALGGDGQSAALVLAAADAAGRSAYGAEVMRWADVRTRLETEDGYEEWLEQGSRMTMSETVELVLTRADPPTTPQRR